MLNNKNGGSNKAQEEQQSLSDCRALVPVHINRLPQQHHHRAREQQGRVARRNVSPRFNDVTCRDLVPHPTKYNRDLCRVNTPRRGPRVTVDRLPKENIKHIFHYLDAGSLCSSEQVCSFWRDCSKDDSYWRDLCRAHFGLCPSSIVPPPDPVKILYMLTYGSLADIKYRSGATGRGSMRVY